MVGDFGKSCELLFLFSYFQEISGDCGWEAGLADGALGG